MRVVIRIRIFSDTNKLVEEHTAKKKFYVILSNDASGIEFTSDDVHVEIRYDDREIRIWSDGAFDCFLMDNIVGWGWE